MTDWTRLLRPSVIDVGQYRPGVSGDAIKARLGLREVVRLNWNENLFGPLPGVLEETADALDGVWTYPEDSYEEFRHAVATWTGVDPDRIIPAHGIQALTLAIVCAFVESGDSVVIPQPTYGLYAQACRVVGANVHRVNCDSSLAIDLEALAAAAHRHHAKLAWVCDPNNPTGLRLRARDWSEFVDALPPGCIAVIDEAYVDYIEPSERLDRVSDIAQGLPVIVMRTFSKIFGLAGLRLGYALVDPSLAPYLNAVHEPFNVNRVALAAGLASLRRVESLGARRDQVRVARKRLTAPLRAAEFRCLPSEANFVLIEVGGDDQRLAELLARDGFLVRPGAELGLPGYIRVTTGPEQLMQTVGERLAQLLTAPPRSAPRVSA